MRAPAAVVVRFQASGPADVDAFARGVTVVGDRGVLQFTTALGILEGFAFHTVAAFGAAGEGLWGDVSERR